jgi:hypothetical protein
MVAAGGDEETDAKRKVEQLGAVPRKYALIAAEIRQK